MAHDLRKLLRMLGERAAQPSAAILDGRTMQSTPESGARAGYDGHKRRKGSKVHIAVDTLGHLLALQVTPANEQERAQVAELAKEIQDSRGHGRQRGSRLCRSRIKDIPARRPWTKLRRTAFGSKWSNIPRRNEGLCFCQGVGWSSDHSLGRRDSAAWLVTMNAWPQLSQVSIGQPLPLSCSMLSSAKVHDTL